MTLASVLRSTDFSQPVELCIDWVKTSIGDVHTQKESEERKYVVVYAGYCNNRVEGNYSSYEGKVLALIRVVTHFKHNLYVKTFKPITDHHLSKWLLRSDKLTSKHARWFIY